MAWINLRAFVNRAGTAFDALKTHVIFAEDMNNIENNLDYLKTAIEAIPEPPTDINELADSSNLILGASEVVTFTNKRIDARLVSSASYTTDTGTSLSVATCDIFVVTAQAGALKFNNPGGTPVQGQKLIIRIKDNGTARALTYDTQFRAMGVALPTTTIISKTLYMGFIYNSTDTKWDLVAVAQEA